MFGKRSVKIWGKKGLGYRNRGKIQSMISTKTNEGIRFVCGKKKQKSWNQVCWVIDFSLSFGDKTRGSV